MLAKIGLADDFATFRNLPVDEDVRNLATLHTLPDRR